MAAAARLRAAVHRVAGRMVGHGASCPAGFIRTTVEAATVQRGGRSGQIFRWADAAVVDHRRGPWCRRVVGATCAVRRRLAALRHNAVRAGGVVQCGPTVAAHARHCGRRVQQAASCGSSRTGALSAGEKRRLVARAFRTTRIQHLCECVARRGHYRLVHRNPVGRKRHRKRHRAS